MGDGEEGERNPRLGGPSRRRRGLRREVAVASAPPAIGTAVVRPRRGTSRADVADGQRIRRFEPFPWWGWVMLAITAVVVPLAWHFSVSDVIASDGADCGSALFGGGIEDHAVPTDACVRAVSDAQPAAVVFGIVAIVLVLTSVTTVAVRGFLPREADTPD